MAIIKNGMQPNIAICDNCEGNCDNECYLDDNCATVCVTNYGFNII